MAKKYLNDSLQKRVKKMLINNPSTRDSNNALMAALWRDEIMSTPGIDIGDATFSFFGMLATNKLISWDSATRAKRLLQEQHPELRGQSYAKRQKKTIQVKDEVKEIKQTILGNGIF
tara:strand:+ start:594 stop:944 length:351 start_codon:yes stop_codon:yes gene_type:complete